MIPFALMFADISPDAWSIGLLLFGGLLLGLIVWLVYRKVTEWRMPAAERSKLEKSTVGAVVLGPLFGMIGAAIGAILGIYLGIQYGPDTPVPNGHNQIEGLIDLVVTIVMFLVIRIFLPAIAGGIGGAVLGTLFGVWITPAKPKEPPKKGAS